MGRAAGGGGGCITLRVALERLEKVGVKIYYVTRVRLVAHDTGNSSCISGCLTEIQPVLPSKPLSNTGEINLPS